MAYPKQVATPKSTIPATSSQAQASDRRLHLAILQSQQFARNCEAWKRQWENATMIQLQA